ncbi:hypothetical protein KCP76_04630 [Salmonella enterica subsp. enterica serovar Weltevreden]|nr:hypothetical protein KCP76_04630 [Salmonella enterica subsp. enterica serovar Weltevreden]
MVQGDSSYPTSAQAGNSLMPCCSCFSFQSAQRVGRCYSLTPANIRFSQSNPR